MSSPKKKRKGKRKNQQPSYGKQARMQTRQKSLKGETDPMSLPKKGGPSRVLALDPLAPIIVRSGRPFDNLSIVDPARLPPPSTVAGCLRTAWARASGEPSGPQLKLKFQESMKLEVTGPLLVNGDSKILVPKPADALYFRDCTSGPRMRCAAPREFEAGCGVDLPDGLLPVRLTQPEAGKPGSGPTWWAWDDFLSFRKGHKQTISHAQLCRNGWSPGAGDRRTHVAIGRKTGASEAGHLFQTEGLDLNAPSAMGNGDFPAQKRWAAAENGIRLLARCSEALDEGLVHLGGERRLAALQPEPEGLWPVPPRDWLEEIVRTGGLCLTLLTPAIFSSGYRPGWLDADLIGNPPCLSGLRLRLCAVAVERWQPHSGWNLDENRPRQTRRLAPAGAVYWFQILGNANVSDLRALWLGSVSDLRRSDGFGIALPSSWEPPDTVR